MSKISLLTTIDARSVYRKLKAGLSAERSQELQADILRCAASELRIMKDEIAEYAMCFSNEVLLQLAKLIDDAAFYQSVKPHFSTLFYPRLIKEGVPDPKVEEAVVSKLAMGIETGAIVFDEEIELIRDYGSLSCLEPLKDAVELLDRSLFAPREALKAGAYQVEDPESPSPEDVERAIDVRELQRKESLLEEARAALRCVEERKRVIDDRWDRRAKPAPYKLKAAKENLDEAASLLAQKHFGPSTRSIRKALEALLKLVLQEFGENSVGRASVQKMTLDELIKLVAPPKKAGALPPELEHYRGRLDVTKELTNFDSHDNSTETKPFANQLDEQTVRVIFSDVKSFYSDLEELLARR